MDGLTLQQLEDITAPLSDVPQNTTILVHESRLEEESLRPVVLFSIMFVAAQAKDS